MFESLKKKFTGTIGKLSDKITEEEELEASETKSSETIEESKNLNEPDNVESTDNTVEKVPETENESETKSGFMGFLRGKPKTSEEDKDNSSLSSETESEIRNF